MEKIRALGTKMVLLTLAISVMTLYLGGSAGASITPKRTYGLAGATASTTAYPHKIRPRTSSVTYGLDVNQFDGDIGPSRIPVVFGLIAQAGASNVRFGPGGGWQAIETQGPGQDNWTSFDANMASAYGDHLSVLLEMGNEPAWDAANGNVNAPPSDCYAWTPTVPTTWCSSVTTWVDDLVNHMLTTTIASSNPPESEISEVAGLIPRNEPQNYAMNWVDPASGGASQWGLDYAHFQQTVYLAAHSTVSTYNSKNATSYSIAVMNGGEELSSPMSRTFSRPFQNSQTYADNAQEIVETLYSTPAFCDSIDTFDFHVGDHGPLWSVKMVDNSELALESCDGGKHLPIWVSEVGYTSIPQVQTLPEYASELGGAYQGGQLGQARYLYDTESALAADPNVVGINWTFVVDPNTSTISSGGALHGLHNTGPGLGLWAANPDLGYTPKLAVSALQALDGHGGTVPSTPTPTTQTSTGILNNAPSIFESIDCTSPAQCIAVGAPGAVAITSNGGSTWSIENGIPQVGVLNGISCITASQCIAVGEANGNGIVELTINGGTTWTPGSLPTGTSSLNDVFCSSTTLCIAVGDTLLGAVVELSSDAGATWTSEAVPSDLVDLTSISCASSNICEAVGNGSGNPSGALVIGTSNGGSTWTQQPLQSDGQFLSSISCPSPSTCLAIGGTNSGTPLAISTSDGGSSWKALSLPPSVTALYQVACTTASSCVATGDAGSTAGSITTTNGGTSWTLVPMAGLTTAFGISCPTSSVCFSDGNGSSSIAESSDGGLNWTSQGPSTDQQQILATACPSSTTCYAVGDTTTSGAILTSTDAASAWTSQSAPSNISDLFAISCPSVTICFASGDSASGGAVIETTNGGSTWQDLSGIPASSLVIDGISCPSTSQCIAVGDGSSGQFMDAVAIETMDAGQSWSVLTLPSGIFDLYGVSCASESNCVAVGDTGNSTSTSGVAISTSDGGASWSSALLPVGPSFLYSVLCLPATSRCVE